MCKAVLAKIYVVFVFMHLTETGWHMKDPVTNSQAKGSSWFSLCRVSVPSLLVQNLGAEAISYSVRAVKAAVSEGIGSSRGSCGNKEKGINAHKTLGRRPRVLDVAWNID